MMRTTGSVSQQSTETPRRSTTSAYGTKSSGTANKRKTGSVAPPSWGDVAAKYNLGLVLQKGGDHQEAETWLRRAAEDGDVAAMYNLGLALRNRHELDGAELWLRRGAEGRDAAAIRDLALLLELKGHPEEAAEWLRRGAQNGDEVAMSELSRLGGELGE